MAANDDDCIKRIVKAYLYFKGEATSATLLKHISEVGYGVTKSYTATGLTAKMKIWRASGKSGSWFNVEPFKKDHITWWRLKK